MDFYKKASSAGSEVSYNMGILDVRNGSYSEAVSHFGNYKGCNLALAQILNGQGDAVTATIDGSNEKDMALAFYLKAVAAARKGDSAAGLSSLKSAIDKDGSMKTLAKEDAEFIKWKADATFTAMTN